MGRTRYEEITVAGSRLSSSALSGASTLRDVRHSLGSRRRARSRAHTRCIIGANIPASKYSSEQKAEAWSFTRSVGRANVRRP